MHNYELPIIYPLLHCRLAAHTRILEAQTILSFSYTQFLLVAFRIDLYWPQHQLPGLCYMCPIFSFYERADVLSGSYLTRSKPMRLTRFRIDFFNRIIFLSA